MEINGFVRFASELMFEEALQTLAYFLQIKLSEKKIVYGELTVNQSRT